MPSPGYFYANTYRPDVGAAYPGYGNWHGFHAWVTVPFGSHQVCVQAQNTGVYTTLTNCHSYNMTLDTMYPSTATTAQCSDSGMWDGGWLACQTDDTDLTYCFETSATLKLWHGVNTTMTYSYDTTDLNKDEETACDYGGSTETDIVWRELSSLPSGSLGFVHCDDATSSLVCDQHYASIDSDQLELSVYDSTDTWKLACHETGHAVGLLHGENSDPDVSNTATPLNCMKTGYSNVDPWLGSNNASYINSTY